MRTSSPLHGLRPQSGATSSQLALTLGEYQSEQVAHERVSASAQLRESSVVADTPRLPLGPDALTVRRRSGALPLSPPYQRHSVTSLEAAEAIKPRLSDLQSQVLAFISMSRGATDEEIARGLKLNPSTARPRRIELVGKGLIREAGTRKTASGRAAVVWRAVEQ